MHDTTKRTFLLANFNTTSDQWIQCPPASSKKVHLLKVFVCMWAMKIIKRLTSTPHWSALLQEFEAGAVPAKIISTLPSFKGDSVPGS